MDGKRSTRSHPLVIPKWFLQCCVSRTAQKKVKPSIGVASCGLVLQWLLEFLIVPISNIYLKPLGAPASPPSDHSLTSKSPWSNGNGDGEL